MHSSSHGQSYYMSEDTLKYEKPKLVVYNVQALTHGEPQKEEYNRMTLDGMKWSKTKWNAINASMCKGENMLDYIFPILRYHSRITSLSRSDLTYFASARKVTHNGYYMRIDVLPASESDVADPTWLLGKQNSTKNSAGEDMSGADTAGEEEDGSAEDDVYDRGMIFRRMMPRRRIVRIHGMPLMSRKPEQLRKKMIRLTAA